MSAGDLPEPPAPTARPAPGPAAGAGARAVPGPPGRRSGPGAPADGSVGPDAAAEVDDVLADLSALPEDAPVLDQAQLLEDVQERLAQQLSGAAR